MRGPIVPLLRPRSTDEFSAPRPTRRDALVIDRVLDHVDALASATRRPHAQVVHDRRATAAALRELDAAWGGGFYAVPEAALVDDAAAIEAFAGREPVVDVQTHLVDATRWAGSSAAALEGFLRMADPERWRDSVDPRRIDAAAWATLVFGTSETAVALLTSTPGGSDVNVLTNDQIASARDVVARYADAGRVLTHTIVHPNLGPAELDPMEAWSAELRPAGWKAYTLYGPPTAASPTGGWFLDDEEIGFPFLERVRAVGPRVVACHKGLGGPVSAASVAAASPRDVGPAAAAFPDVTFVVYHSGYEIDPTLEGAYDPVSARGVDRLVHSLERAGIGPGGNVYAELGSTWFLMLRRPPEAVHVLGKLLRALGPERIVWGTDSIWYGSPQPLIDAFRAFTIPEAMQEEFGYPPLDAATKELILSVNARRVYGIDAEGLATAAADRDRTWVDDAAVELRRRLEMH